MIEKIKIEDESGDKKYFTIIPNYILNHSTPHDRDLYIQMKRIAGENGTCWTSQKNLAKQCNVSINRLKKSLAYLLEHNWIKFIGKKQVITKGGNQEVLEYKIVDLWNMNNNFYLSKGVSPNDTPDTKGVSRMTPKGYHEMSKGVSPNDDKEEPLNNNPLNKIADETSAKWDFKIYLEGMENHKRRDLQIIALYWQFKKFNFTNKKQAEAEIKRCLRATKSLEPYEDDKIWRTMEWLAKNADFKWTAETVGKYINEDLKKLKLNK